jgi:hypothetical protein
MNTVRFSLRILILVLFAMAFAAVTQAQATRTWVSGVGDDVNPCSRTAPCKTFAGAISKTAASGEIDCLDPGGFGTVTITKSITIDGTLGAGFGGILSAGTNGVNVNDSASATPNTAVVTLRSLSIDGAGTGVNGVNFTSGKTVNIEGCWIFGLTTNGVNVALTSGGANVNIKDTNIFKTSNAVRATSTNAGGVTVSVDNCRLENNSGSGVRTEANGFAEVRNTLMSFNATGVNASASGNLIVVDNSQIASNTATGVSVAAGATVRLGRSLITANIANFSNLGTIQTFGNNETETTPIPGAVTPLALK